MIKQKTVLILGAGASIPYGFPSGNDLSEDMIRVMRNCKDVNDPLCQLTGARPNKISGIGNDISATDLLSIDRYLLIRGEDDKSLTNTVKSVMACRLYHCEKRNSAVRSMPKTRHLEDESHDHWYRILWDRLQGPLETFKQNQLTILTFNYDRSLTEYLYQKIMATYRLNKPEAAQLLRSTVKIIHLHGSMGIHPALAEDPNDPRIVPYGVEPTAQFVSIASKHMKIVHEESSTASLKSELREIISEANRVVFLGLSYQEENLEKLFLCGPGQDKGMWERAPIICGTTFEMYDGDVSATAQHFAHMVTPPGFRGRPENLRIGDYLKETGILRGQCMQTSKMTYVLKRLNLGK